MGFSKDQFQQTRPVRLAPEITGHSRSAGIALAWSLFGWVVPLAPFVALLVGGRAWMGAKAQTKPRRIAVAVLLFAFIGLMLQVVVGVRSFGVYQTLHRGPVPLLADGPAADKDQPIADEAFFAELESRYGRFLRGKALETPPVLRSLAGHDTTSTYALEFEHGDVTARAQHHTPNQGVLHWPALPRLVQIEIEDPTRGPLTYPRSSVAITETFIPAP